MAQFQFVMRTAPDPGKTFPLEAAEMTIGRDASNPISINDSEISRRHAKLTMRGSTYVIEDTGSTNGTFVNGQRLTGPRLLNPGDRVSLGENIALSFEAVIDPNATMVSPAARTPQVTVPGPMPAAAPAPALSPTPVPGPAAASPLPPSSAAQAPAPAKKKHTARTVIIIVIVVVVLLCLCVGLPYIADALKLDCDFPFKYLFNIVGPMAGYAACP
jgi:pSer/pThr/pTyr-binding forkhead associated (FHA) protein